MGRQIGFFKRAEKSAGSINPAPEGIYIPWWALPRSSARFALFQRSVVPTR